MGLTRVGIPRDEIAFHCRTHPGHRIEASNSVSSSSSPFGQNEWLVEEMYRKFRDDPSSVDPSWHEFLVDYHPEPMTAQTTSGTPPVAATAPPAPAPAAPPAPAPPAPPAAAPAPVAPAPAPAPAAEKAPSPESQVLRGAAAAVVKNMNASLQIPTATSVRAIPRP